MYRQLSLSLPPEVALDEPNFRAEVFQRLGTAPHESIHIRKVKQSIDARKRQIKVNVLVDVYTHELPPPVIAYTLPTQEVTRSDQAIIVGAGPAGLFAALRLIELGIKPVILERGKDVRSRRRDIAAINKQHLVNPESNYCFGEGGAGTYSDGKLYTRSTKRGNVRRILEILVAHGADEAILVEAHPHIGTNKLPQLVANLRETILSRGGEIHFETKVVDFAIAEGKLKAVVTADGKEFAGLGVILATGHSARDIFELLHRKDVYIEAKPFAMGVRIEHSQALIDRQQYHCSTNRGPYLPAASYSLVTQTHHQNVQRGVFSFCMCPGGFIVPSATAPGELVVNGMSPSRRDSRFANSGLVVSIEEKDLAPYKNYGPLAGMYLQKEIETRASVVAGGGQWAPAQRIGDFLSYKASKELNDTSYIPGLRAVSLDEFLPTHIAQPLRVALKEFGNKIKGYATNEGQLIGVESRTSSPVRIPRLPDTLEHPYIAHLFPSAEGAGYAGGIMSAAIDGERCAEQLAKRYAPTLIP